jgi:hypothetical protein
MKRSHCGAGGASGRQLLIRGWCRGHAAADSGAATAPRCQLPGAPRDGQRAARAREARRAGSRRARRAEACRPLRNVGAPACGSAAAARWPPRRVAVLRASRGPVRGGARRRAGGHAPAPWSRARRATACRTQTCWGKKQRRDPYAKHREHESTESTKAQTHKQRRSVKQVEAQPACDGAKGTFAQSCARSLPEPRTRHGRRRCGARRAARRGGGCRRCAARRI